MQLILEPKSKMVTVILEMLAGLFVLNSKQQALFHEKLATNVKYESFSHGEVETD